MYLHRFRVRLGALDLAVEAESEDGARSRLSGPLVVHQLITARSDAVLFGGTITESGVAFPTQTGARRDCLKS
jgi:hypothetical protein